MNRGGNVARRRRRAVLDIQRLSRGFLGRKRAKARKNELATRIQASPPAAERNGTKLHTTRRLRSRDVLKMAASRRKSLRTE